MNPQSFGHRLYKFYSTLQLEAHLPSGIEVMNPYKSPSTLRTVETFCEMFYNNDTERLSIWGINPGRFGGGITGLSFTDPLILHEVCGIEAEIGSRPELSAEYVWRVIEAFGGKGKQGAERFFSSFFLTALCPLGFVKRTAKSVVNYNFYDDKELFAAVKPFMLKTIQQQCELGLRRDAAICLGTGKLQKAFESINNELRYFDDIIALEHPRFIMQYRRDELENYIQKYVKTFQTVLAGRQHSSSQSTLFS